MIIRTLRPPRHRPALIQPQRVPCVKPESEFKLHCARRWAQALLSPLLLVGLLASSEAGAGVVGQGPQGADTGRRLAGPGYPARGGA